MEELIIEDTFMKLLGIEFKVSKGSKSGITVTDNYEIKEINEDSIVINLKRKVIMNFDVKETLIVEVQVKSTGTENVNFKEVLTDSYITQNIENLLGPTFGYLSNLISQITGAFGRYPFITAPGLYNGKE